MKWKWKDNEKSLEVKERNKGKLLLELFPNAPLGATCKAWQKM
jgi:TRAP-type C4-dicarboxylate transport system substrate-binding protein